MKLIKKKYTIQYVISALVLSMIFSLGISLPALAEQQSLCVEEEQSQVSDVVVDSKEEGWKPYTESDKIEDTFVLDPSNEMVINENIASEKPAEEIMAMAYRFRYDAPNLADLFLQN